MKRPPSRLRVDKAALFGDLGYVPHAGQREVHFCAAPRRVVACGVRWGKTLCAAMEGLAAALQPAERSIGWIVAPTYDLSDRVFREVQVIALTRLQHRVISMRESERRLVIRNMAGGQSEIRAKSMGNPRGRPSLSDLFCVLLYAERSGGPVTVSS